MGWLGSLLGGGAIGAIGKVVDDIFTSDEEREQAKYMLEKLRQHPYIVQAEINKEEARHKSLFVAGWRPFIGWVCGLGLAFVFLVSPLLSMFGAPVPVFPIEIIYNLVLSLLGIGGMRTYEKLRGVHSDEMKIAKQPELQYDWDKLKEKIK